MKRIKLEGAPRAPQRPTVNKQQPLRRQDQSKPKGKSRAKLFIFFLIVLLLFGGAGGFLYWRWDKQIKNSATSGGGSSATACTDILDPKCWTDAFKPQLDKFDGKTNALIVGIDTRESGSGAGLANTDTILLATYYHETGESRLISFPRDLYAPYGCSATNQPYRSKINAIYAYGRTYCDSKDGMETLSYTIEKITGEKIQYTTLIRLEGVIEGIDEIGGITVNVPKDHTDVYPFIELPKSEQDKCVRARTNPGYAYCVYTFKAGPTQMDGQTALIYARMRYWSSDFDRARRQQEVITAIKDKVTSDDQSLKDKANNLLKLSSKLGSKVEVSKLDLDTMLAGLDIARKQEKDPLKVVIDPSFGGGGMIYANNNNYQFNDYTFKSLQDKLNFINANADLYRDRAKIYAVNHTGSAWTPENPAVVLKNSGFWFMEIITDTKPVDATKSGVEIIDYTNGVKQLTVDELKKRFEGYNVKVIKASDLQLTPSQYKEEIAVHIYDLNKPSQTPSSE